MSTDNEFDSLLPPEQRREHIEALGDQVADVPLDDADSENSRYKAERGE